MSGSEEGRPTPAEPFETPDEMEARWREAIEKAGALTEEELRDADVPWPETPEELAAYIAELVDRPHSYGTCVYAMSMAATAAFRHVAKRLGVTGFQASCADLDILRRTRHLEHGFQLLDYGKLLYPQYASAEHFPSAADLLNRPDVCTRIAEAARKNLATSPSAHPDVLAHWHWLASLGEAPEPAEAEEAP